MGRKVSTPGRLRELKLKHGLTYRGLLYCKVCPFQDKCPDYDPKQLFCKHEKEIIEGEINPQAILELQILEVQVLLERVRKMLIVKVTVPLLRQFEKLNQQLRMLRKDYEALIKEEGRKEGFIERLARRMKEKGLEREAEEFKKEASSFFLAYRFWKPKYNWGKKGEKAFIFGHVDHYLGGARIYVDEILQWCFENYATPIWLVAFIRELSLHAIHELAHQDKPFHTELERPICKICPFKRKCSYYHPRRRKCKRTESERWNYWLIDQLWNDYLGGHDSEFFAPYSKLLSPLQKKLLGWKFEPE